jgi:hypothetical protein
MWIWLIATLVFFSIPKSKLIGYVMVAVPPLAVLVAEGLRRAADSEPQARAWAIRAALIAVAINAVVLATVAVLDRTNDNTKELAAQLQSLAASPADPVVTLDAYPFSLAFYARRLWPLVVVEDWHDEWVMQKDTWRRELLEAAEFAPDQGRRLLLTPKALPGFLACTVRPAWLIVPSSGEPIVGLAGLERVAAAGADRIWRRQPSGASDRPVDCGR